MKYVASDIHGNYDLFVKLLKKIHFSKNDTFFIIGDVIDKGSQVSELLNLLLNKLCNNVVILLGNHELEFNNFVKSLINLDADDETILDECKKYLNVQTINFEEIEYFKNLQAYYEDENFILAHAGVPCDQNGKLLNLSDSTVEQLVYDRSFKNKDFIPKDSKCVIFGHTPTIYIDGQKGKILKYQKPNTIGNKASDYYKIHIDTGNYLTGILGCLRLDDMQEFYVREFN